MQDLQLRNTTTVLTPCSYTSIGFAGGQVLSVFVVNWMKDIPFFVYFIDYRPSQHFFHSCRCDLLGWANIKLNLQEEGAGAISWE